MWEVGNTGREGLDPRNVEVVLHKFIASLGVYGLMFCTSLVVGGALGLPFLGHFKEV